MKKIYFLLSSQISIVPEFVFTLKVFLLKVSGFPEILAFFKVKYQF